MKDKLIESASKEALSKNIETEIKAGKDPKQAAAIAYSVQKANDAGYHIEELAISEYNDLIRKIDELNKDIDRNENNPNYPIKSKVDELNKLENERRDLKKVFGYCFEDNAIKDNIQITSDNIRENIKYTMQSDITPDLYFYIGEKYAMKEGSWTYAKYKLNEVSPEKLKSDLKANGWHEVSKGPASFIDANKVSEQTKICQKQLNDYPVKARTDMKNCSCQEAEYLAQFNYAKDIYNSAPTDLKAEAKMQLNKVLVDLQNQFNLKRALQITDKKIKDKKIVAKYEKIVSGQPIFCNIIQHGSEFTAMSSEPKDDKDFSNLNSAKVYLENKGYTKVSDTSIFTVKYKDRIFKVKAKDHKEAGLKVYNKLKEQ